MGPEVFRRLLAEPRPGRSLSPRGPAKPDGAGPVHDNPKPSDELTHYKTHPAPPAEGEVLAQEDKDKSAAWKMPIQLYLQ